MEKFIAHGSLEKKEYQSVFQHVTNVSELSEEYAGEIGLSACGKLAGLLHDMGKLSDQFQNYIKKELGLVNGDTRSGGDHAMYGAAYIFLNYHEKGKLITKYKITDRSFCKITTEILAMVICYHHGGMEDFVNGKEIRLLDRIENASLLLEEKTREWLEYLELSKDDVDKLFVSCTNEIAECFSKMRQAECDVAYMLHLLIKYLYSCLIDADRTDTARFMRSCMDVNAGEFYKPATPESEYLKIWEDIDEKLTVYEGKLHNKKTSNPGMVEVNRWRQKIWEDCFEAGAFEPGVYTLTVPTGGGKTLSSFRFAINHAKKYKKRRIVYILPFISIIEQNADVIRNIVKNDDWILEHHCNVMADKFNDSTLEKYELMTENWDVPIIFSTLVQFLNIFYSASTQDMRRLHNLSNSIIIFDEVQAVPVKCISMFNETVNFLAEMCGCTIVMSSATQPTFSQLETHKIRVKGEMIKNVSECFTHLKRMQVVDQCRDRAMTLDELVQFGQEVVEREDSVLIVMNTKEMALNIYHALSCSDQGDRQVFYLSTNLCPAHRRDTISILKEKLSAENRKEKIICVSTQLIEAGVDISFSCVIRHICGLDSIAQASGRGNRNGEKEEGKTYIVNCLEEKLGPLESIIGLGETQTAVISNDYSRNPLKYDEDLLSPQAIEEYFKIYFSEKSLGNEMDYPVKNENKTIYEMLRRSEQRKIYKDFTDRECPLMLDYQFRTASKEFKVIDENTKSVLVPYKKGKELIAELESCQYGMPDKKLLRELQQYSINLYDSDFKKLDQNVGIELHKNAGIYILKERYYNDETGLDMEGLSKMDINCL